MQKFFDILLCEGGGYAFKIQPGEWATVQGKDRKHEINFNNFKNLWKDGVTWKIKANWQKYRKTWHIDVANFFQILFTNKLKVSVDYIICQKNACAQHTTKVPGYKPSTLESEDWMGCLKTQNRILIFLECQIPHP